MGSRKYLVLPTVVVLITFLVITVWEFAFEARITAWLAGDIAERDPEQWRDVITVVVFTALALVAPVARLRAGETERGRIACELRDAGADLDRQVARRTEELQASNEALRTSEERYRLLMETSPDAVSVNRADKIVFVNQAALQVFGARSEAQLVGRDPLDFIHPDDHASVQARRRDLAGGRPVNPVIERRCLRLDGTEFAGEARAARMNWDGEPASLVVLRDITEQKLAEKAVADSEVRLSRIMDSAADGIITIDERGTIESINRSAILAFGYAEEEVLGKNISMLMPEPHRSAHDGYLARYRDTGKARIIGIGPRELTGRRKDGSEFPSEVAISEARLGERRLFIGIIRDITDRKREQELFQQAQKMEAVGQLTGGVAHDFNNLLTTIVGNLELLDERIGDDKEAGRFAGTAMRAALRGADLTQRLLAFSRKQPLDPAATEINKCLIETTELIRRTIGEDIEIETVLAGGLWDAMVDRNQLENALLNIAINARDAMPGGGRLTIETANSHLDREYSESRMEVTPGQYVMIAISDTGAGMTPEVMEQVFDPFFTTKEVGKGTGLGLSMVYGFAKQSGGHVAIYSEPGNGTTVKLYLPRTARRNGGTDPGRQSRTRAMPTGHETILVVEDDADVRAFVCAALQVLGYHVLEARDGPAALSMLERFPDIDMLLADIVLPGGMNGREIAEEFRRRKPGIVILFTSGYTENAIVHQGRLDPGVNLIAKPYRREVLAERVRTILDERGN